MDYKLIVEDLLYCSQIYHEQKSLNYKQDNLTFGSFGIAENQLKKVESLLSGLSLDDLQKVRDCLAEEKNAKVEQYKVFKDAGNDLAYNQKMDILYSSFYDANVFVIHYINLARDKA